MKRYSTSRPATTIRLSALKLCYRCGERFDPISVNGHQETLSEFQLHEAACLLRAQESDQRKRDARQGNRTDTDESYDCGGSLGGV